MKKIILFSLLVPCLIQAQQTPAPPQNESILITAVTAHIGNGVVIENAAIGFDNGVITYVGATGSAPSGYDKLLKATDNTPIQGLLE